jgi:DNA-binding transcriptional LysR family regulator
MNFRDLKAFVAVAETGSISRAALRLHLTQPAATRRVQSFEAATGAGPLFDRRAKPLVLTPAGRRMLAHCREILKAVIALEADARAGSEPTGELRIGVGMGAEIVLGSPLDELRRRFPRVELRVSANWTARLIEALRNGELDVAVAFVTADHVIPPRIKMAAIGTETIAVVAARDTVLPRVRGRRLRLSDLAGHRWVLNPLGCAYRLAVERAHDAAGVPLRLAAEVIGHDLQLSLVARGAGLGLISRRALSGSAHRRALRVVSIADFQLEATVAMLHAPALGNFASVVDLLQQRVAQKLRRP